MPRCIYCLRDRAPAEFSREHVVHEGFGRFQNALTLIGIVCRDCNQLFGDTIDRELQREGPEGLERYRWGAKKPEEVTKFQYNTVTLRAKDVGEFSGAEFTLLPGLQPGELVPRLVPKVLMRHVDDDGYAEFTEAEIRSGSWRDDAGVDWKLGIRVIGDEGSLERLTALLKEQGIVPSEVRQIAPLVIPSGQMSVSEEFHITDAMYRAIAKIAFNYLAYREGREFALAAAFNPIRDFIRHGVVPTLEPVHTDDHAPFRTLASEGQRAVVHFVAIDPRTDAHDNLLGIVSLFGFLTHVVMLAENFQGPWPEPHAHLFNPKDWTVHPWKADVPFTPREKKPRKA